MEEREMGDEVVPKFEDDQKKNEALLKMFEKLLKMFEKLLKMEDEKARRHG